MRVRFICLFTFYLGFCCLDTALNIVNTPPKHQCNIFIKETQLNVMPRDQRHPNMLQTLTFSLHPNHRLFMQYKLDRNSIIII